MLKFILIIQNQGKKKKKTKEIRLHQKLQVDKFHKKDNNKIRNNKEKNLKFHQEKQK